MTQIAYYSIMVVIYTCHLKVLAQKSSHIRIGSKLQEITIAIYISALVIYIEFIVINREKDKMSQLEEQKVKLEQKKNRLAAEELKLRFKERRARTRNLIELGGLIIKAGLDMLPVNTLYGGLLTLKDSLEKDDAIQAVWVVKGNAAFNREQQEKVAIILKLEKETESNIRELLREHGLMWNKFRNEWYGYTTDLDSLKEGTWRYLLQLRNH